MDLMNAGGMEASSTDSGMWYRSRRDRLEAATCAEFAGSHEFRIAAMRKTIAFPIDRWIQLGDSRLVVALVFAGIGCGRSGRETA